MKKYLIMSAISALIAACANTPTEQKQSFIVDEKKGLCTGYKISVDDQLVLVQDATRKNGMNCVTRPVTLQNNEVYHRGVCFIPGGEMPFGLGITKTQSSCESAIQMVKNNPEYGLQNLAQQRMESGTWLVGLKDRNCIPSPFNVESFADAMARETGKSCTTTVEQFPAGSMTTLLCGDMQTGTAWLLVDSQEMCQQVLNSQSNQL